MKVSVILKKNRWYKKIIQPSCHPHIQNAEESIVRTTFIVKHHIVQLNAFKSEILLSKWADTQMKVKRKYRNLYKDIT